MLNQLEIRKEQELQQSFSLASDFVEKNYLSELNNYPIAQMPYHIANFSVRKNIRLFKINKLVYDKNEDVLDKLSNVFNTIGNLKNTIVLIIDSDGKKVDFYIGVRTGTSDEMVGFAKDALEKSFNGNFLGSEISNLKNTEIEDLLENILESGTSNGHKVISSISGIPSLKDEEDEKFVQGIEKLIDAMYGEKYSAIFIADAVSTEVIKNIKNGYESLYSKLSPFKQTSLSYGQNDSIAITEGLTTGITNTVSDSVSDMQSYTKGKSEGTNESESKSKSRGASFNFFFGVNASTSNSTTFGTTSTNSWSNTKGTTRTKGTSDSYSNTKNNSETRTDGETKQLQIQLENKSVINLLDKIDNQLERLKSSEDFGMWNCSCYFLADDVRTVQVASSTFKAMMRGKNSAIEHAFINVWSQENIYKLGQVKEYLKKLHHPLIDYKVNNGLNTSYVNPTSLVNGEELTIKFGLPRKSINGLSVIETSEFGRNVITHCKYELPRKFSLGNIFHKGREEDTSVELDINSLAMHTFITGSTGAGKSNTIYHMLEELKSKGITFLVIEPAKGEYKEVFGGRRGVHVYGSNPKHTPLLKINPFRFPEEIHVLEHIDRLVEIFNACWPMYAAMPAVLKESMERTYEQKGWDLETSTHYEDMVMYPTFSDLLYVLPMVIDESGYSEEMKSNYIGALVTRVKSLTNGLVGRMFSDNEVDSEIIFDKNCIIDLSRIGSSETKALLMGILFLRLHEYRMAKTDEMNIPLKHITVLEEAHHLLRKTSISQSQEGANLQGKSVEMITNAIAEMRTYGEGFIIADQSPNSLDSAVIKNTNTKIIMRLPAEDDREEVGYAASLNDNQIDEIPKLKTGVAVVYQNNWLQPVLCQIPSFKNIKPYNGNLENEFLNEYKAKRDLMKLLLNSRLSRFSELEDIDNLKEWINKISLDYYLKQIIENDLMFYEQHRTMKNESPRNYDDISKIVFKVINGKKVINYATKSRNLEEYSLNAYKVIKHVIGIDLNGNQEIYREILHSILHCNSLEKSKFRDFYFSWVENERQRELML